LDASVVVSGEENTRRDRNKTNCHQYVFYHFSVPFGLAPATFTRTL
jgi:hypothetical protein